MTHTPSLEELEAPPPPAKRWWGRAFEPLVLFPVLAAVALAVIWTTAFQMNRMELAAARLTTAVAATQLAATYEAQIVRALQEIDQTLKVVKYAYESRGEQGALLALKARALLPADLVFVVSIADSRGDIVASTRPPAMLNVADQDYFQKRLEGDRMLVGRPRQGHTPGDWRLEFARPLDDSHGGFAGFALLSVDAAYFVSGYEASQLGQRGLLELVGTDGVIKARRTGDAVTAGGEVAYASVLAAHTEGASDALLSTDGWDGVQRYTSARELFSFPLAVVVGLSEDEQLATVRSEMRIHLWIAAAASFFMLLTLVVLARMSRQLALGRRRAADNSAAHAARVEYLAYHDGLTTLPNRSLFSKLLVQAIAQARRHDRRLAVLFLDLDRFKHINDTLGHEAGDELLREVATRLKACLRDSDTVARLGGDEFVALLPELGDERYAATVARKILAAVGKPFTLRGHEMGVTASIGISTFPQDGKDEQTLKKNADVAMYRAKEQGKNNFQFYSERLNAHALERLALETALRKSLELEEFELYYQARQETRGGHITGLEVLLRWNHAELGAVAPLRLIQAAEEAGLSVAIGKWVLRTACRQHAAWALAGYPELKIAVNMSARQFFDPNLLDDLAAILAETRMEAGLLELEISEGILLRDMDKATAILARLRAAGVGIALDDFGSAYSALSALKVFPIDVVKVARAYVRDDAAAPCDRALTAAVIAMGKTISPTVVAQGVETREQAEFIRQSKCDEFQGFYLGVPMPAAQVEAHLGGYVRQRTEARGGGE